MRDLTTPTGRRTLRVRSPCILTCDQPKPPPPHPLNVEPIGVTRSKGTSSPPDPLDPPNPHRAQTTAKNDRPKQVPTKSPPVPTKPPTTHMSRRFGVGDLVGTTFVTTFGHYNWPPMGGLVGTRGDLVGTRWGGCNAHPGRGSPGLNLMGRRLIWEAHEDAPKGHWAPTR